MSDDEGVVRGFQEPRVATPLAGIENRTDEIAEVARKYLGIELLPWQRLLLDHITAVDADGMPPYLACATVARQQGKSTVIQAYLLWHILNGRRVITSAQRLGLAQKLWRGVAQLFDTGLPEDRAPLQHLTERMSKSTSGTELELVGGAGWWVRAQNADAARGLDAMDVVWFDEARGMRDMGPWDALVPTLTTSDAPQILVTSNAGSMTSTVLNDLAKRGRQRAVGFTTDDDIVWLEWSADPSLDVDDLHGWRQANPSLGYTTKLRTLKAMYRDYLTADNMNGWRTERLCQQVGSMEAALDVVAWKRLADPTHPPLRPTDRGLHLSVSVDLWRRGAVIMAGRQLDDGRSQLGVLTHWEAEPGAEVSDRDVADELVRLFEQWRPTRILYNSFIAAGVAHLVTRRRLPMFDMKGRRYFDACQVLTELIRTGNLIHDGADAVSAQVMYAQRETLKNGDGFLFSRRSSPGPIYTVDAAAMLAHQTSKRRGTRTGVVTLAS